MDKAYFTMLAAYNKWANEKAMYWLSQISDEQWSRSNTSSFSSIRQTAIHMASAEKIWVDFWTQAKDPVYLSTVFSGTKTELISIWAKATHQMEEFIGNYSETGITDLVSFIYPDGRTGQMRYEQTFAHIINHSTYHRGQLVTPLRQADFHDFISIDLATYYLMFSV